MKSPDTCFQHMVLSNNLNMSLYINWRHLGKCVLIVFALLFYCEVLIYYVVLIQCTWPQIETKVPHSTVKAMLLADTHLLGPKFGHWFDKLRREWQMYRVFQTTMTLHYPEVVFMLGDIFDEGFHCEDDEFDAYVKRFHSIFSIPQKTKMFIIVGNHDIGFHYRITRRLKERFEKAFNLSSIDMIIIKDNIFVTVNSMALENDGCFLCKPAELKLGEISQLLTCAKTERKAANCHALKNLPIYTKPIFLQHFPLFRSSDFHCSEADSAPNELKTEPFQENWDCLSKESTIKMLNLLEPRAAFTGHTHHGCFTVHKEKIPEWTIASFSWRNKNDPSFILGTFAPDNFGITKCYMPRESTVINTYIIGGLLIAIWIFVTRSRFFQRTSHKNK